MATVVIASRDRPIELARCVRALQNQETALCFEIVVVDDGSEPPVALSTEMSTRDARKLTVIRRAGSGPARARNAGVAHARAPVVLFTDDDTVPAPRWLDSACTFLSEHPDYVGVEGPTTSPSYDPLYFHSVRASAAGTFLTCNVAYRRAAIEAVEGFSEVFPSAHGEDLDLGFRIARLGPVGYEPRMAVLHPPMRTTLIAEMRRGRRMVSDGHLFRRHPDLYPASRYLSASGYALFVNAKHWAYSMLRDRYSVGRDPRRAARFLALALGYSAVGTVALAKDFVQRAAQASATPPPQSGMNGGLQKWKHR